jgi:hypothetical protein
MWKSRREREHRLDTNEVTGRHDVQLDPSTCSVSSLGFFPAPAGRNNETKLSVAAALIIPIQKPRSFFFVLRSCIQRAADGNKSMVRLKSVTEKKKAPLEIVSRLTAILLFK